MARVVMLILGVAFLLFAGVPAPVFADYTDDCVKGRGETKIAGCTRAIESGRWSGANLAWAYNNRGNAYKNTRQYDNAIADYTKAIRLDPSYVFGYNGRGNALLAMGEYDRAIADYNQALSLDPNYAYAYNGRGNAFKKKRQYDLAIADYTQSIRLDPDYPTAYNGRGNTYRDKGMNAEAIADYNQAIRLNPRYHQALNGRANAYLDLGEVDRAIADYDAAIEASPSFHYAYNGRGNAWRRKGDNDRAIADYNEAIRHSPGYSLAYNGRGNAYLDEGDLDRAIADYNDAIRLNPTLYHPYNGRGIAYRRRGDLDRAITDYTEALRLNPNYVHAYNGRANAYYDKQLYDRAITNYSEAIRRDAGNALAFNGRGNSHKALGQYDRALSDYSEAARLNPSSQRYRNNAASVEGLAGQSVTPTPDVIPTGDIGRRVALVIGNSAYANAPRLRNPESDARAVADVLRQVGFASVTLKLDLGRDALIDALRAFSDEASTADWAIVYFAGHGLEIDGRNYLIPVDARLQRDSHVRFEALELDDFLGAMGGAKTLRLAILDACRNNPFANRMQVASTRSLGRGLGRVEPGAGTLVAYAARHGQLAQDGDGANSPYATALLKHLRSENLELGLMFRQVRDTVVQLTGQAQEPFTYGSLSGEPLYFVPRGN